MTNSRGGLTAEIVTTGTEILLGEIVDTNAAWIAQQLRDSGINLYYKTTVGDNQERVRQVIRQSMERSDVVLVTGGLGPTKDDITRQAIAAAADRELILDEGALTTLKERFARFGVHMTENNVQQAYIPAGAIIIENPVGTAPGFIVEGDPGTVIAMPGVPREMKHLMTETILPYLRSRNGNSGIIRRRVLRTVGIGESSIDHALADLMELSNPTVGLAAHVGQVDVRITASAETEGEVERLLDEIEASVRERVGRNIYSSTPGETFVTVLAGLLSKNGASVAFAETNTEGAIAERLTRAAGNDSVLSTAAEPGAIGTNPNQVVVSEEIAIAVAADLRSKTNATYAVAVIGTTGQDEGVFGSRSGETWVALAGPSRLSQSVRVPYGGREETTKRRIGNAALTTLWRALQSADGSTK